MGWRSGIYGCVPITAPRSTRCWAEMKKSQQAGRLRRNPVAKDLRSEKYRPKIVANKRDKLKEKAERQDHED
jgi:hypothetical protein